MHVGRRSAVTNWAPQSETRHRYHRRQSTGPVAWYITEYYRSPRQTFGWDYLHREYIFTKTFIYNQYCLLQHCKIIHLISLITSIHLKQKKSWPQNSLDKISWQRITSHQQKYCLCPIEWIVKCFTFFPQMLYKSFLPQAFTSNQRACKISFTSNHRPCCIRLYAARQTWSHHIHYII